MSKLCRHCSYPMPYCKKKMPYRNWFLENLQLFIDTMTEVKTTVFNLHVHLKMMPKS